MKIFYLFQNNVSLHKTVNKCIDSLAENKKKMKKILDGFHGLIFAH